MSVTDRDVPHPELGEIVVKRNGVQVGGVTVVEVEIVPVNALGNDLESESNGEGALKNAERMKTSLLNVADLSEKLR